MRLTYSWRFKRRRRKDSKKQVSYITGEAQRLHGTAKSSQPIGTQEEVARIVSIFYPFSNNKNLSLGKGKWSGFKEAVKTTMVALSSAKYTSLDAENE